MPVAVKPVPKPDMGRTRQIDLPPTPSLFGPAPLWILPAQWRLSLRDLFSFSRNGSTFCKYYSSSCAEVSLTPFEQLQRFLRWQEPADVASDQMLNLQLDNLELRFRMIERETLPSDHEKGRYDQ